MWSRAVTFDTLRAELAAAGIQSDAIDLPMHDIPPGAPAPTGIEMLTLADYADAVTAAAARFDRPPILCGHSMGGLVAQLAAVRLQSPGLILLATAPSAATPGTSPAAIRAMWTVTRRWGWWHSPTLLDPAGARAGVYNGVPEADTAESIRLLTWDSGRVLAQIAAPFLDRARGAAVDYARLTMPALVLVGSDDRMTTAGVSRRTARKLSGRVDYEELPGAPHWLFHDAVRGRVGERIARFVTTL